MRNILLMLLFVFIMVGSGYADEKDKPPDDYKGSVAERPKLVEGERWEYIQRSKVFSEKFVEEKNGQLIFRARWEDGRIWTTFRTPDLNFIKLIHKKDEVKEECDPYRGPLRFPLWVGKKWSYTFSSSKYIEYGKTTLETIDSDVKVVAYEQVKVPAGTFWAFKIEEHSNIIRHATVKRDPRGRLGYNRTVWYSPEVKAIIKREEDEDVYNYELTNFFPIKKD